MKVKGRARDADSFQPWDAQKEKCDGCGGGLLERHDVLDMACSEKEISEKSRQKVYANTCKCDRCETKAERTQMSNRDTDQTPQTLGPGEPSRWVFSYLKVRSYTEDIYKAAHFGLLLLLCIN